MRQQIHINDQGELLLIEVPDKPKSPSALAPLVVWGYYDKVSFPSYQAALTSAIEKGIKFRDQEAVFRLLFNQTQRSVGFNFWKDHLKKGQSFDLPNSYTAQVEYQRRSILTGDWVASNENEYKSVDGDDYIVRKVAVLTPLKQARSHSSETIKRVLDSITPEEQEETERKMLSGEPATVEKSVTGNEAKKEEQLFTKEDLRTAFEAGESHYDFENWFIEKFD